MGETTPTTMEEIAMTLWDLKTRRGADDDGSDLEPPQRTGMPDQALRAS